MVVAIWNGVTLTGIQSISIMERDFFKGYLSVISVQGLSDVSHRRAIAARQLQGAYEVELMTLLAEVEDREVYRVYGVRGSHTTDNSTCGLTVGRPESWHDWDA